MPATVATVYTPFFLPMKRIVERVRRGFDRGGIVRLKGFPISVYCLREPEHVAQLFNHPEVRGRKYPAIMPRVKAVMGNGAYVLEGADDWKERRQKVQALFKRAEFLRWTNSGIPAVDQMLDSWHPHATSGAPFDSFKPLQLLITHIDLKMFFNLDLPEQQLRSMQEDTHFVDLHFVHPSPLWLPLPNNIRFNRSISRLRSSFLGCIRERRAMSSPPEDLLSHLLQLTHDSSGLPWTDEDILGEIFSIYFGASVMSTSLGWMVFLIASHPDVQRKMAEETEELLQGRALTAEDLGKLRYSQCVVKEALRLFPPSWGYPRFAPEGMTIDGVQVPPRSLVIPMVYITQRDPRIWKDATAFRPERFDPESGEKVHPSAYLPFGSGPRTCLGAGLAPMIMQMILVKMFSRYQLAFTPRYAKDPIAEFGFEIHPRDQIRVRITDAANGPIH
jgi:cytochrome P450